MSRAEAGKLGGAKSRLLSAEQTAKRIETYNQNPKLCKECNTAIPYDAHKRNEFCSRSCSAIYHNRAKVKGPASYTCEHCGTIKISGKGSKNRFCNSSCQQAFLWTQRKAVVEAGTATSGQVKRYLIEQYGEVCLDPLCAWDFSKRPIRVELEHKDGNAQNNSLENCTLLCPNCHSTTSTYKAKNKGNGRMKRLQRYHDGKTY